MTSKPFLWGALTSAHQVEGQTYHNDWWEHAKAQPQLVTPNQASGHYDRWPEDFRLAKSLGHNAHRLSLEWSRLEPARHQFSAEAVAHYRQVLQTLRDLGLTSIVTLHHFTNPIWFHRQGGWQSRSAVGDFTRYVEQVVAHFGDLVDIWLTIHEPVWYAQASHHYPAWPKASRPSRRGEATMRVHLAAAHRAAYRHIHKHYPTSRVAVPMHYHPTSALDTQWVNSTRGTHDFIALNWDSTQLVIPQPETDFTTTVQWLKSYAPRLPILIASDGIGTADDRVRAEYIRHQLRTVENLQAAGALIQGYIYRSLLDGYEWTDGFEPQYGLIAVDYTSQARQVRTSARVLQAIIGQRA